MPPRCNVPNATPRHQLRWLTTRPAWIATHGMTINSRWLICRISVQTVKAAMMGWIACRVTTTAKLDSHWKGSMERSNVPIATAPIMSRILPEHAQAATLSPLSTADYSNHPASRAIRHRAGRQQNWTTSLSDTWKRQGSAWHYTRLTTPNKRLTVPPATPTTCRNLICKPASTAITNMIAYL